jgi:hypothetical protein
MLTGKGKRASSPRELCREAMSLGHLPVHVIIDFLAYEPDGYLDKLFARISVTNLIDAPPEGTLDAPRWKFTQGVIGQRDVREGAQPDW